MQQAQGRATSLWRRALIATILLCANPLSAAEPATFLGAMVLPDGLQVEGTTVGGLSGLAYDPAANVFHALTDDRYQTAPSRLIQVSAGFAGGFLSDLRIAGMLPLRGTDGQSMPPVAIDGEAVALIPQMGGFLVATEGDGTQATPSRLLETGRDGRIRRELPVPAIMLSDASGRTGAARNKQIEAIALSPDGAAIWVGIEAPLRQDTPQSLERESFVRLTRLDRDGGQQRQIAYPLDPLPVADADRGLVELVALPGERLLVLERSYSRTARTNFVRLYLVETTGASEIGGVTALPAPADAGEIRPATKRLLVDFNKQRLQMDNYEAMALGPALPDGRRVLLVASDNNFNANSQRTIFVAFALDAALLQ